MALACPPVRWAAGVAGIVVALLSVLAAPAQAGAGPVAQVPVRAPSDRLRVDGVENVIDQVLTRQLAARKIPGAAVALVANGRTVFSKGYGSADVARGVPVDPKRTLFRTGSVGKLFTWTAVMQLVEQGKLKLDADVNTYLDVKLPDTFANRPVTLHHLLTHTAGFEELVRDTFIRDAADLRPLGDFLRDRMPERVRPPGEVTAYSNYGAALAGYIVQRVSGVPYDRYLEERLFGPLQMRSTSSRQPLPTPLADRLSTGYQFTDGNQPQAVETVQAMPAGSHSATVTDMARFMLAHLGGGRHDGARILSAETAALMHAQHFSNHPQLPGMAYGFYERSANGQRIIEHAGDTLSFHTKMMLLPEHNIGLYVAYNGAGDESSTQRQSIRAEITEAFVDHLAPRPTSANPAPVAVDVDRFVGSYLTTRSNVSNVERIAALTQLTISAGADGTLRTPAGQLGSDDTRETVWEAVGPLLFRERGGQGTLGFRQNDAGNITHAFEGDWPPGAWERVAWWQSGGLHQIVAGVGVLTLLLGLLGWTLTALILRLRRRRTGRPPLARPARRARAVAWTTCIVAVAFILLVLTVASDFENAALLGFSATAYAMLATGALLALATLTLLVASVVVWHRRLWRIPGRLGYSALAVAALGLSAVAGYYNLAGVTLG